MVEKVSPMSHPLLLLPSPCLELSTAHWTSPPCRCRRPPLHPLLLLSLPLLPPVSCAPSGVHNMWLAPTAAALGGWHQTGSGGHSGGIHPAAHLSV
jgi:hypothetical protein